MAGNNEEVKLIGAWASPFTLRATVALKLKGVAYEFLQEPFGGKSELLLKSNPVYKNVPVLLHNDMPISESMIIVEYLDEVWSSSGPALLPADSCDRAIARFWAHFIDDKWLPGLRAMVFALTDEAIAESVEQISAGLQPLEEAFEKCSKGRGFFNGDTIGYVDIALGGYVGWIRVAEVVYGGKILDKEKTPLLLGWAERFCRDPAVKELMPETEKLVEMRKMLQTRFGGAAAPSN